MLDNVLTHFIDVAPDGMKRARYSALRERSVGLGAMGFHSFLQHNGIPFESALAKSWNLRMFRKIRREADAASRRAGGGARRLPGCRRARHRWRASATSSRSRRPPRSASSAAAPAPASSRSRPTSTRTRRCRARSPCAIRQLQKVLAAQGRRHPEDLAVDPRARRLGAASRRAERATRRRCSAPRSRSTSAGSSSSPPTARRYICQGQSLNLYLPADIDKWDLHMLHWTAWKRGVKSLYYCRSKSISARRLRRQAGDNDARAGRCRPPPRTDYEECLACQ